MIKYNFMKKTISVIIDDYINLYFEIKYNMVLGCFFLEAKYVNTIKKCPYSLTYIFKILYTNLVLDTGL